MTKLDNRIEQLQDLKDKTMVMVNTGISRESYLQLLVYHIGVLKEIRRVVEAIESDNVDFVQQWYEGRRQ